MESDLLLKRESELIEEKKKLILSGQQHQRAIQSINSRILEINGALGIIEEFKNIETKK